MVDMANLLAEMLQQEAQRAGAIETGPVSIGKGALVGEAAVLDIETSLGDQAQLGHSSSLHAGQAIPDGERRHGSPAQRTEVDYRAVCPQHVGPLRTAAYVVVLLLTALLVTAPLLVGVGLCRGLDPYLPRPASLKWPNDVLCAGAKLAGVLIETRGLDPRSPHYEVGIGLNVDMTADGLPVPEATSLALAGDAPDRTELLGRGLGNRGRNRFGRWRGPLSAALKMRPEPVEGSDPGLRQAQPALVHRTRRSQPWGVSSRGRRGGILPSSRVASGRVTSGVGKWADRMCVPGPEDRRSYAPVSCRLASRQGAFRARIWCGWSWTG